MAVVIAQSKTPLVTTMHSGISNDILIQICWNELHNSRQEMLCESRGSLSLAFSAAGLLVHHRHEVSLCSSFRLSEVRNHF